MGKVKLGIVGLGRLGGKHAENLLFSIPDAELAAICSLIPEELEAFGRRAPSCRRYTSYREMFSDPALDGVVIATSSQSHCEMAIAAAELGVKNVYIEKPLGMTLEEVRAIRDAVEKSRIGVFQVGYNRRFDASYMAMKKKIDEGYIGKPIQIRMVNRDPASMAEFIIKFSPTSGGLVFDMLTHDYDVARWVLGCDAKTVYGLGGVYAYSGLAAVGDIDNCGILCRFENGVMGWFETTRCCPYGYHVETEVFGTGGCIRVCVAPTNDRVLYLDSRGINQTTTQWFYEYWEPTFAAEIRSFVDSIQQGRPPVVGLMDGYKAVEWAIAAKKAVDEETVVKL